MGDFAQYFSQWSKNGYPYSYELDTKTWTMFGIILVVGLLIAIVSHAYVKTANSNE
jgi:NADH:ubiquinone oxidoreductase subunit 5 (subunit L)/multisubunit Na+/H+ antiporter MnhA subunit